DFPIAEEFVDRGDLAKSNWRAIVREGMLALFPDGIGPAAAREIPKIVTNNTQFFVRDAVVANPGVIGGTLTLEVPVADPYDQLQKGTITRDTPEDSRRLTDEQIGWFDTLVEQGRITTPFNWGLIFNADSRFPEIAGLAGAIAGTFYAVFVCFLISFPLGVAAAAYLEEFAPRN